MGSIKNNSFPIQKCISGEHVRNLSDTELLSVVIGSGTSKKTVYELASGLYYLHGGLHGLYNAGIRVLAETNGIGLVTSIKIASSLELGRRIKPRQNDCVSIKSPESVWLHVLNDITGIGYEIFIVLILDTKNRIIAKRIISVGTVSETVVHPREIFRDAVKEGEFQ
jgi:DNA repair protein RadC